jgi:hypothetical protein
VKRLRELEKENTRPRKAVSDLTLGKMVLQEGARSVDRCRGGFARSADSRTNRGRER